MSVNRYDVPVGQRYTSSYIPLPLDEIGQMAKQYSADYKAGKQAPHALDQLEQAIKAAPVDFDNKKILMDDYHSKMNDIVSTAKPEDYAKPEYQQKINTLLYNFKNDPRLNAIANNKEMFDKVYQPYLSSKEAQKDLVLTDVRSKEHPTGYSQLKPGQSLAPLDYVQHEDAIKGSKTIMDDIKIDGIPLSSISQWKRDGNYFIDQDGHRKEITPDKVMNLAKANVANYAENTEGRFRFKTLLNKVGLDPHMSYTDFKYSNDIPKETKDAISNELANDLYSYGSKQIFKDTDISYNLEADQLALHRAKKGADQEEFNKTTSTQSEALMQDKSANILQDLKFDSKGNLTIPTKGGYVKSPGYDENGVYDADRVVWKADTGKDLDKMAQNVRAVNELKSKYPSLKDLSPKETVEAYNKAKGSLSAESIPLHSISNVAAKNIGEAVSRNKQQRNFYLYDSKGKTIDGTFETVLDNLGISEEDFDKALKEGISGYTQAGPSAGSYYVSVKDDDGNSRRVMISPDEEMKTMFKTSHFINEARKTMEPQVVKPFDSRQDIGIKIVPNLKKDGTVSWNYSKLLYDKDGNVAIEEPTTLDEIRKDEKEVFEKSNYLGSQVGVLKPNTTE